MYQIVSARGWGTSCSTCNVNNCICGELQRGPMGSVGLDSSIGLLRSGNFDSRAELADSNAGASVTKTSFTKWNLSLREWQVFRGIATGKEVKEIAVELELSPKTVGTYRDRVKKKTGLTSHVAIALYYERNKGEFE